MIGRMVEKSIGDDFFKGKAIVIAGARQVGKTTITEKVLGSYSKEDILRLNGDNPTDRSKLDERDIESLTALIGQHRIVFIDEAQKIPSIGQSSKLIIDRFGNKKQLILTGSASFNLLTETSEPLTGRKFIHELFPLSVEEIIQYAGKLEMEKQLENLLVYGSYPEVYLAGNDEKERLLTLLVSSYLFKDILELQDIRNPAVLHKLLTALALQVGSEVSLNELGKLVGMDAKTVERYIDLLEKNYIIFRLPPYYSNKRKSISKLNKVYFYDLGVRNVLINNFNGLEKRNDVGALWENFIILERMKQRVYKMANANQYFWRSYEGAEVDLVEESGGELRGYEIKWGKKVGRKTGWLKYGGSSHQTVNRENYLEFIS